MNARVKIDDASVAPYDETTPSLLAQQPLTRAKEDAAPSKDWDAIYGFLEARLQSLRSWRWTKWSFWLVLARFFLPYRSVWLPTPNRMDRGHPVNDSIIDSTGLLAVRTAAGGMWTGLTSPSRPWMRLAKGLPWIKLDKAAEEWLQDTTQRLLTVLAQSNFYSSMAVAFRDLITFGTAPVIIYEDEEDAIRCYNPCVGEYSADCGARLSLDVLYREFTYNVHQIVDFFKIDNCPKIVVDLWTQGGAALQNEFIVAHAIEPNTPIAAIKSRPTAVRPVPSSFAFREVYWLRGQKTERYLSARGFNGKPFMGLRWATVANDPYGHGPCEEALGDNKQIQLETRRKAEFIGKGVRPPMGADPALKNEPASIIEGNITYFSTDGGKKGFFPLFEPNPQWLPGITADIVDIRQRIDKCLFVDLFMAISRMEGVQPRNQLELTKRDLERLQELGPVIELVEKELDIGIRRILNIMTRRKMLLPVPPTLNGVPLKVSYTSILRLAQRSAESVSMKDVLQTAGALSSAAKAAGVPDPIRTIDLDKALRHYAELNEFPSALFFTDGEVAQHDQIRHEEMMKAQAPQQLQPMVDAAKTLSDTNVGGNSALSAMLGTSGQ